MVIQSFRGLLGDLVLDSTSTLKSAVVLGDATQATTLGAPRRRGPVQHEATIGESIGSPARA